jgi:phosphoglucomutase
MGTSDRRARALVQDMDSSRLGDITALLRSRYSEVGDEASARLSEWCSGAVPHANEEIITQHLHPVHLELIVDAFWRLIPFGTGGRRGAVGYGPNRINPATVGLTIQAHCTFLKERHAGRELAVVVANDVRVFTDIAGTYGFLGEDHPLVGLSSRSLGRFAAEIYAANGITAFLNNPSADDAVLATPELAYAITKLGCVGGVNFSASHNPPDDNGVKVYNEYGAQPVPPEDQELASTVESVATVERLEWAVGLRTGLIRAIPAEVHGHYLRDYEELYDGAWTPRRDLPIVFTPLCGCGLTTAGRTLRRLGFKVLTPPSEGPDGTFAVLPFRIPNPEVPEATDPAKEFGERNGAGLVVSSDPDADRVGIDIRLSNGDWKHLTGNQIAAVLCYFLMLDPQGPRRQGLVIETTVTTKLLGKIADAAGESWIIDDLLVGFKYVAAVLHALETEGSYDGVACGPERVVIAAEESHGILMLPSIRDKDATPAAMYMAALYQRLASEGKTLLDYYIAILEELGGYGEAARSIVMTGDEGVRRTSAIMASLRREPPDQLGGETVAEVIDYWDETRFGAVTTDTARLSRDVVQFILETFIVTVRPSGTEPKLKLYSQALPDEQSQKHRGATLMDYAEGRAQDMARDVYSELLSRVGVALTEAALHLPDIVPLTRKQAFDASIVPVLREKLSDNAFHGVDEVLTWLRAEASAMTPGADPLPALRRAVASVCQDLGPTASPLTSELYEWATETSSAGRQK